MGLYYYQVVISRSGDRSQKNALVQRHQPHIVGYRQGQQVNVR